MAEKRITYSLEELARILLAHEDIHEGEWEIGFNLQGRAIMTQLDEKKWYPGIVLGITQVNLVEKPEKTQTSFTAT